MYGDVVLGCKPVRQGRDRPLRGRSSKELKKAKGVQASTPNSTPTTSRSWSTSSSSGRSGAHRPAASPRTRASSSGAPSAAVFGSWNNDRAIAYRQLYDIPDDWGTAVNVQAMVFGNSGDDSGTGVAFTRDPASGENVFYGEFLVNAQGEDVVAGVRTPRPVDRAQGRLPDGLRAAAGGAPDAGARDARHAGLRVHRRARAPLHAADAQRQADRPGGHPHRRRHGRRGPDHAGRGAHARRARAARTSCCGRSSRRTTSAGGRGEAA